MTNPPRQRTRTRLVITLAAILVAAIAVAVVARAKALRWPRQLASMAPQVFVRELTEADTAPPAIDLWYGKHQVFGLQGQPQRWVNILGRVSDRETQVERLTYTLNDSSKPLPVPIGPDDRRLVATGDFNIELDSSLLPEGVNRVAITAVDTAGNETTRTVSLEQGGKPASSLPYTVDWPTLDTIQDAAQVVDGYWILDSTGLRTHPDGVGYDRVVAIGDRSWSEYEVTVPFTVHNVDETSFLSKTSVGAGMGVVLRWGGHTNQPVTCPQIHCGWLPYANFWMKWDLDRSTTLQISENQGPANRDAKTVTVPKPVSLDQTYWLKGRLETAPEGSVYKLKLWQNGEPEPQGWDLQLDGKGTSNWTGSVLLVAHNVDMTFGTLTVSPLQ
jgi:hypothetical protein